MAAGRLYVISAPSGTGKTTVLKRVLEDLPDVTFSVSHTTRSPRPGEVEGVDYHFVSREEFQKLIEGGGFVEWTEVHGNYYGTSRVALGEYLAHEVDVILDIDTHGADQIHQTLPDAVLIFILPPGIAELKDRLARRGSESREMIDLRLQSASKEIEKTENYDYVVVNERIEDTVGRIKAIILAEKCRQIRPGDDPNGSRDG
jgi:guanylate kinase